MRHATLLMTVILLTGCAPPPQQAPRWRGARVPPSPEPPPERLVLTVGDVPVSVRVAHTPAQRTAGLRGVTTLGDSEGLLLVYPTVAWRTIWMKGCELGLDVAFLDDRGVVREVVTLPAPRPGQIDAEIARAHSRRKTALVLEVPAGFFAKHGVKPGTPVVIPPEIERYPVR